MSKSTNERINELQCAIGAIAEINGELLKRLIENGFTREEAVDICIKNILLMMHPEVNSNESE